MTIRWHWGVGVGVVYGIFAASTLGFVAFAMSRPVSLVSDDYYADSLREDQKRAAVANARALGDRVRVSNADGRTLAVTLPVEQPRTVSGTVTLYRASDAAADRVVALALQADGTQRIPLRELHAGQWLVRLRWTGDGRDFYVEQAIEVR